MSAQDSGMFRDEALEQLNSPEQLEQLLKVTGRRAWITLLSVAAFLVATIAWAFFGQIPITVDGVGVLVFPRRVVSFQAPASGQIAGLSVSVGDAVEQGDVLASIAQPSLATELLAERERLAELELRNTRVTSLSGQRSQLETEAMERQRVMLDSRIASATAAANTQRESNLRFIEKQIENVDAVIATQGQLEQNLRARYKTFVQLKREGLSSNDIVLNARQRLIDNEVKTSELRLRRQEIELSRIKAEEDYQNRMQQVEELRDRLQDLSIGANRRAQEGLESASDREIRIASARSRILKLEKELETRGQIVSEKAGRVLELTVREGQVVASGQRLGSLETRIPNSTLRGLAYLRVGDGKKISEGMELRITPSTIERARHGSMRAVVADVTSFPVTTDAVIDLIGSREVAEELMQNQSKIQLTAELLPDLDAVSGFAWTSGTGPPDTITAGTTASVRATVEYRRPITFVIPILRRWSGV